VIRPGVVALIDGVNPAEPATYAPLVAHCAACYADECCPLCDGPLGQVPASLDGLVAAAAGIAPVGACLSCGFLFIGPDPRDPGELTRRELTRIKAVWMLAAVAVMGDDDPPGESPCDV
jgi:hypothetical protein